MSTTLAASSLDLTPVDHGVSVRWFGAPADADDALRAHVALLVGVDADSVEVGRRCGRCGSAEHGRPWASHDVHVSLARSGPHLVTAVSTGGAVGVDVEALSEVDRAWDDVSEPAEQDEVLKGSGRTALWCRAEAAMKRDDTGRAAQFDPHRSPRGHVDDLVAPSGYCAAVAYT